MASGNRGNSASNTGQRVHILCCSIEHSGQNRQGDWAGNRQAGNRESWPRVLSEFLRRVNGYPTPPIYPPLSMHPSHVYGLAIRSALASCLVMRSLGGCQSIALCFRLMSCLTWAHDMTHPYMHPVSISVKLLWQTPCFIVFLRCSLFPLLRMEQV